MPRAEVSDEALRPTWEERRPLYHLDRCQQPSWNLFLIPGDDEDPWPASQGMPGGVPVLILHYLHFGFSFWATIVPLLLRAALCGLNTAVEKAQWKSAITHG